METLSPHIDQVRDPVICPCLDQPQLYFPFCMRKEPDPRTQNDRDHRKIVLVNLILAYQLLGQICSAADPDIFPVL